MNKKIFFSGVLVLLLASVSLKAQDTTRVSLLFVGDIMQHDSQIQAAYNAVSRTYDYTNCFRFVKPYFESVDVAIGNLELTLAGSPYKGYPLFSAPDALAVALKEAGMDVLVTANNHSADRRRKGVERTIHVLDSVGILHTGTFTDTTDRLNDYPLMLTQSGIQLALLNYTYGTNGISVTRPNVVNMIDTAIIRKDILKAKQQQADAIVVFMHWGNEYVQKPSAEQVKLAELCFKWGAQAVIGSHPHVLQPMQWKKEANQFVVYSLGNFVSGQRDRYKNGGAMVRLEFQKIKSEEKSITEIKSANYILEWVYRTTDAKREYFVLPVPDFENDSTGFIRDEASRAAMKLFIEDSRNLLNKTGSEVTELREKARREE